jgi:hypothetical protein
LNTSILQEPIYPGPQILKTQIEDARHSIKELKFTMEAVVETGDTVWARGKATGVVAAGGLEELQHRLVRTSRRFTRSLRRLDRAAPAGK